MLAFDFFEEDGCLSVDSGGFGISVRKGAVSDGATEETFVLGEIASPCVLKATSWTARTGAADLAFEGDSPQPAIAIASAPWSNAIEILVVTGVKPTVPIFRIFL